ncbi:MAG TPA: hypothetical protein VKT77_04100 [Chthonomonadaceae bacterium]|nr:hypothetical protein [Chthonomonadaceae bacterium]
MKVNFTRMMALGGALALMLTVGAGAFAQDSDMHRRDRDFIRVHSAGYRDRDDMSGWNVARARREIMVLKRTYDHEIRSGHPAMAMKAHLKAKRIREWLRAHNAD